MMRRPLCRLEVGATMESASARMGRARVLMAVSDSPKWLIRPLALHEIEHVAAVLDLARLDQGDGFYLVAWEGDEPLGHAHLALTDPPELQDVSVRIQHRRRGVATTLTEAAERESRKRGFDRLRITVSVENEPAQALYRNCGYGDTDVPRKRVRGTILIRTGPIEVDDTLLTWEKPLASRQATRRGCSE